MNDKLLIKYERLVKYISSLNSVAVAFSSGVDSTLLLYAAHKTLGDKVLAVTAESCLFTQRELTKAKEFCNSLGIRHVILQLKPLEVDGFAENPKNRCYICKYNLMRRMRQTTDEYNLSEVIEGSNLDDLGDYRPGMQAIAELKIKSPLRYAELTKQDIRYLSKHFGLSTWNKPSFACLASRFPYGALITEDKLNMVGRAEQFLSDMGFMQFRVRIHDDVARIELLPEDFPRFMEKNVRETVYSKLRELGFSYIALDIMGYRTGNMNGL